MTRAYVCVKISEYPPGLVCRSCEYSHFITSVGQAMIDLSEQGPPENMAITSSPTQPGVFADKEQPSLHFLENLCTIKHFFKRLPFVVCMIIL